VNLPRRELDDLAVVDDDARVAYGLEHQLGEIVDVGLFSAIAVRR
jgi:hypothetical protein